MFALDTFTNYSNSDYNGFRPNPESKEAFAWNSPPFEVVRDFYPRATRPAGELRRRRFRSSSARSRR